MKTVIVDRRIGPECEKNLFLHGFMPILLPSSSQMTDAISSHPDSLIFRYKNEIIASADYCEEALTAFTDLRAYSDVKIHFTDERLGKGFPYDARMNALVMGERLFCNIKTVSESILKFTRKRGLKICHTNQAYPACSTLTLGEAAAITADRGLAEVMQAEGIRVTLIKSGNISLPPYEYGFIGGACGVFGNKVYFFGDYHTHPDAELIEAAIRDEGLVPISLSSGPLTDFGGMLFFN